LKKIAFFDFDGTITTKDTLLEIIKFQKGKAWFCMGFLLNSPFLVAYKMGLISNQKAKERILTFFFGKTALDHFQKNCDEFALSELEGMIRPKAILEINQLKKKGFEVVIVSASASNWLKEWTSRNNLSLIATELEVRSQKITGKIIGKNCYGEEKVMRIKKNYDLNDYQEIYCYGDTRGDLPMLSLSTIKFFKPFR
jgi:phosphatidylglycerophosphatase C